MAKGRRASRPPFSLPAGRPRLRGASLIALASCLVATAAWATPPSLQGFAETGPEYLDREYYVAVTPGIAFENEALVVQLAAPLRLRMNPSLASERGLLRGEDWDALSDAGRVLRRFELTLGERTLSLRMGAFAHQSLGHGTLVNGFGNALDPDRQPLGVVSRVAVGPVAVDALAADVLGAGVLGASVSVEPLSFGREVNDRVHLTLAAFGDHAAPRSQPVPRPWLFGAGLDAAVWRSASVRLAPYFDANLRGSGFGLHVGLLADLEIGGVALSAKSEWRRFKGPYAPEYFDVAYAVERWDAGAGVPKADADAAVANGWRVELRARGETLGASAAVASSRTAGTDATGVFSAELGSVQVAAFAGARGVGGVAPERLFFMAEGRYRIGPFLYAWGSAGRLYRIDEVEGARQARPVGLVAAGIGAAVAAGN